MMPDLPKITQARLQIVNADSKIIGDGTTDDPTAEERAWIDLIASTAPELDVKKKRVSVCAIADVVDYDTMRYRYGMMVLCILSKSRQTVCKLPAPANGLQWLRLRHWRRSFVSSSAAYRANLIFPICRWRRLYFYRMWPTDFFLRRIYD